MLVNDSGRNKPTCGPQNVEYSSVNISVRMACVNVCCFVPGNVSSTKRSRAMASVLRLCGVIVAPRNPVERKDVSLDISNPSNICSTVFHDDEDSVGVVDVGGHRASRVDCHASLRVEAFQLCLLPLYDDEHPHFCNFDNLYTFLERTTHFAISQ